MRTNTLDRINIFPGKFSPSDPSRSYTTQSSVYLNRMFSSYKYNRFMRKTESGRGNQPNVGGKAIFSTIFLDDRVNSLSSVRKWKNAFKNTFIQGKGGSFDSVRNRNRDCLRRKSVGRRRKVQLRTKGHNDTGSGPEANIH